MIFSILLSDVQGAANLGMVARTMANMGFTDLRYSGQLRPNHPEALKYAVHASNILQSAIHAQDREHLFDGLEAIYAFSPRTPWGETAALVELPHLGHHINALYPSGSRIGLLFGNEANGLNNTELTAAQYIVNIPTSENYRSLNLSQAVAIVLWEIKRNTFTDELPERIKMASYKDKKKFTEKFLRIMEQTGYIKEHNRRNISQEITHTIGGLSLTDRQMNLLTGILSKISLVFKK